MRISDWSSDVCSSDLMHERYGKWNSVYVRFRRWAEQGVWDGLLQTLVDLGLTDDWQHMIDSTTVRGHVSAVGGKGGMLRTLLVDHAGSEEHTSELQSPMRISYSVFCLKTYNQIRRAHVATPN